VIEIKNLLFQPLTLHLAGDGRGLPLNPREIRSISYVKQISTSSCGMVGVAERGPINKPVLVTG
jgi:hypothetical protein